MQDFIQRERDIFNERFSYLKDPKEKEALDTTILYEVLSVDRLASHNRLLARVVETVEGKRKEYHDRWEDVGFDESYEKYSAPMDALDDIIKEIKQDNS